MNFLRALLSSDDVGADSVIACMLAGTLVYLGISGYVYFVHPELWNPMNFGTGLGLCIAPAAVAKGWRDRLSPQPQPEQK